MLRIFITLIIIFLSNYALAEFVNVETSKPKEGESNVNIEVQKGGEQPLLPRSVGFTEEFEKIHNNKNDDEVINLIKPTIESTTYPYLYEYAIRIASKEPENAIIIFSRAGIRARYDAMRCSDATARQGISFWPRLAQNVKDIAKKEPYSSQIDSYMEKAIELEVAAFPNYKDQKPSTVCFHGMNAVIAGLNKQEYKDWYIPEDKWKVTFDELVENARKSLNKQ